MAQFRRREAIRKGIKLHFINRFFFAIIKVVQRRCAVCKLMKPLELMFIFAHRAIWVCIVSLVLTNTTKPIN